AMRVPDGSIGVAPAHGTIEQNLPAEAKRMKLLGGLGGSVRLFLQRNAVDGGEIGSERRHVSSTGAIVAPLLARQELEIGVFHDPGHSGSHSFVMKMMAHRQQRRTSIEAGGRCPLSGAKRTSSAQIEFFRFLPKADITRVGRDQKNSNAAVSPSRQ